MWKAAGKHLLFIFRIMGKPRGSVERSALVGDLGGLDDSPSTPRTGEFVSGCWPCGDGRLCPQARGLPGLSCLTPTTHSTHRLNPLLPEAQQARSIQWRRAGPARGWELPAPYWGGGPGQHHPCGQPLWGADTWAAPSQGHRHVCRYVAHRGPLPCPAVGSVGDLAFKGISVQEGRWLQVWLTA